MLDKSEEMCYNRENLNLRGGYMIDINNAFEITGENVSAERAAAYYGIEIKKHRCRCPFHNGKDFNLSFKNGGFNCFVCGTHGDSIEFVRLLFGYQKPFEALKRINEDFCLGLGLLNYGAERVMIKRTYQMSNSKKGLSDVAAQRTKLRKIGGS
jgi:hypothetical protein